MYLRWGITQLLFNKCVRGWVIGWVRKDVHLQTYLYSAKKSVGVATLENCF